MIIGYGLLPVALLYCFSFVRSFGKWIAIDGEGLTTSWGRRLAFSQVTDLNRQRWKTKGIAIVSYRDGSKTRKLVLDSYKFDRGRIAGMVEAVGSNMPGGGEGQGQAG